MQERNDLGVAMRNDVARESRERRRAGAARIDDGGDAGIHAADVRVYSHAAESLEDVRVQVDQAGRDDLAGHLDRLRRLGRGDVLRDASNLSVFHGSVRNPIDAGSGIEDGSTLQQEIVHVIPPGACVSQRACDVEPNGLEVKQPP
jgi:hypothetical protein